MRHVTTVAGRELKSLFVSPVAYGVLSLFAEERVVDKSAGRSKVAHLRILAERSGCAFGDMLFVDDNHTAL